MKNRPLRKSVIGVVAGGALVAVAVANGGCSAVNDAKDAVNNVEQATSGCDEFDQGETSIDSLSIDGDTKAFVDASSNFVTVARTSESAVLAACIAIDGDLQIPDTWTAMAGDGGSSDAEVTEACKQAADKIPRA